MVELFAGLGDFLLGLSAAGFVLFLHRIVRPLSLALEASAKRDGGRALRKVLEKLTTRE